MADEQHPATPPVGVPDNAEALTTDQAERSRLDKIKEIAPIVTVLGAFPGAVTCLNFASAHNIYPYSSNPLHGLFVGTGLVITSLGFAMWAIVRKTLKIWKVLGCLVAGSVGSVLATAAIIGLGATPTPVPGASLSAQTALKIESPTDNQRMTGGFELWGRLLNPLRTGDTLWVFANDGGNPDADRSGKFTLLRGPCTVDAGSNLSTCPVNLAQDANNNRLVTLTVLSVTAAQARHFVEDLYAGAQLDQNRRDCGDGRCPLVSRPDPRNKNGLPGGKEITVTDHRTVTIPKP
ncbi:hypothetical protein BS329_30495 [Amycolatopsis coloradensis]|uniref:Uncharacterized protein n=1 Tax=Amycolatopsis coloradensis TaxID=76021 RepID=A0A1R0KKC1_9PSEU|nr:hypothetical protein [Amycolatopsis coloradensis]OLZ46555.1 hypothetical protein BS329_30495 [Amycolatopsis coloradensis]